MKASIVFALALGFAGCVSSDVRRAVHVREQVLLLPEAVGPAEPWADRIAVLHASGQTSVFEGAVVGRDGDALVVRTGEAPVTIMLADARAVQLERNLVGPERDRLVAQHEAPPDVVMTPAWAVVLGVIGTITAAIIVVNELGE